MSVPIHQCECPVCQSEEQSSEQELHHQMNILMSRMNEQQRRWYAAIEAQRYGHGGIKRVAQITGLGEKTIRRGQQEMEEELVDRPHDRSRLSGGGRPRSEKKTRPSNQPYSR